MNDVISKSVVMNMCRRLKRYILLEHNTGRHLEAGVHYDELMFGLDKLPTVDAVPVVRCKDCIHRHSSELCECRPEDAFCSDGERVDKEG